MKTKFLVITLIAVMAFSFFGAIEAESKVEKLDDAPIGSRASKENPFFTYVVQGGIADPEWQKVGEGEYLGPTGKTYLYKTEEGTFTLNNQPVVLPTQLKNFVQDKPVLSSIDYNSLGLTVNDKTTYQYDANGRVVAIKDADGHILLAITYENGNIKYITDRVNHQTVEYATTDTYTYSESGVREITNPKDPNYAYKYVFESTQRQVTGVMGKVLNVFMTDDNGNIMRGNNIVTNRSWPGYLYFADKAPLVPFHSVALPPTTDLNFHLNDPIKLMEVRYNSDGSIKNIRYNTWAAGLRDNIAQPAIYAYRIDNFDASGMRTTAWYNDPAPTAYEPTFTGVVKKDPYNRYYIQVATAFGDQGQDQTSTYSGKTYLLTTRLANNSASGQPGNEAWRNQRRESAVEGGASEFTNVGWDSLIGKQVTLQGHLMTNPNTETGIYAEGEKVGVFSAFNVL